MTTCNKIERARAHGNNAPEHDQRITNAADVITLDETDRNRRRLLLTSDSGIEFLLELPSVTLLMHDDLLCLSDGRLIRVQAKPEPLYEVHGSDKTHLLTLTWHVGNRHLATQIMGDHVRIRRDPVIRDMLEHLGATITEVQAGFNPQGGAYGDATAHHHHHHHHD